MFHKKNQIWNKPNSFYRVRTAWADAKKNWVSDWSKESPTPDWPKHIRLGGSLQIIRLLGFRCAYISNEDTKHKEHSGSLGALPNTGTE